jgi:hypothetical protein
MKLKTKWIINSVLILGLFITTFFIIKDLSANMVMRNWWELILFEFNLQLLLEINSKYLKKIVK